MNSLLSRQGQRLLQIGILLIIYSSFDGFVIPYLASPRIGLSVHTLSALQGVLLLAQGLLLPKLNLVATASRIAFWCSLYGTFRYPRCLYNFRRMGSGQRDDHPDGGTSTRTSSRNRFSGDVYQDPRVFVCADGPHRFLPHSLGLRAADARSLHD